MNKKIFLLFLSILVNVHFETAAQINCCCGTPRQMDFPGMDFEIDPFPPLNNYFYFTAFTTFGPWNVTQGTIDFGGAEYCGGLGVGNPNGQSHFIDLFGSPPTGSVAGTIEYPLYGLTPGYQYTIEFWYATFTANGNFSANLKVANGSWLNVSWTANNPGAAIWLKKSYTFIAQASSANLAFTDTGSSSATYQIGMLLDDVAIFECPTDLEKPVVNNPPDDYNVECDLDVPPIPTLDVMDNCDANPAISFKEIKETFDPCTKKITRTWEIKDVCGNTQNQVQIINIIDQFPPDFIQLPRDTFAFCQQDVLKLFNDWVKQNGFAIATDACDVIIWKSSFIRGPVSSCDTVTVSFKAIDHCGKESTESAKFYVRDTGVPRFVLPAVDKDFSCIQNVRDSLKDWLFNAAYSSNEPDCDTIIKSNNFDGDSTKNPIVVTFYAKDRCGNVDSSTARFTYRSGTDTIRITQFSCTFPGNSLDTMIFSSGGCDSVVISERIRRSADSTYITANSCDPKIKAFDTLRLNNQFGCDSFIFTHILIHPVDTSRQKIYDCNFTSMSVDTAVFIGQFCDSIVLTEKIPLRKDSIFIQQSSCDSLAAGVKVFNLINANGCDSVVSINTTFSGVIIQLITKNECGLAKNYIDTLIFSTSSCDSLVITNHIGLKIDTSNIQRSSCDLTQAGIDTLIYQTATCDSIVIVNTLFIPADTTYVQQTSCDINQVGISSKLYNTSTCDSLVIINTQFIPSDTTRISLTTCDISQVGIDSIFFATSTCDSLVITTTSFKSSDTSRINQTTCLPASAGLDTVLLQKSNGCDSLVITNTLLVPLRLQFKLDSITCHDKADAKISILNEQDFNKPYTVYLNQSNVGQQNQLTNLGPGIYKVYIKDRLGCITDSIEIDLQNPEAFITELGNEQLVTKGSQVQLQLQTNHTWQHIQWNPSGVIGCMDCNPVNFKVDQDTWIYSLAIDERNCESLDSVLIRVREERKVFVPNSFSPNGDNINDYFYVQGDNQAVVEIMQIFDRWGNQVFEIKNVAVNDPLKGWNGKTGERYLNPGVYVYYIEIQTNLLEKQRIWGDISLIR